MYYTSVQTSPTKRDIFRGWSAQIKAWLRGLFPNYFGIFFCDDFRSIVTAESVASSVDALLWFATAMSGTALQLMLVLLLLSITSYHLLRHQQLVIGLGAACFHAAAGARTILHCTLVDYVLKWNKPD